MLKGIVHYAKNFSLSLLHSRQRNIMLHDFNRYCTGQKVISNTTINPWSNKTYTREERVHALEKAVNWLLHSQQSMKDDGFGSFGKANRWSSSYVETSGYIVPTLLGYGINKKNDGIIKQALKCADWLLTIQKPSGGWQGECVDDNRPEVVFNTGQVIRGLISAYNHTREQKYLDAAARAGDWLCEIQEPDGSWKKNAFMNVARVYDSYVDAPLLMLHALTGKEIYKNRAVKNLRWIIHNKQSANGWFTDCDNTIKRNDKPILHTIAYTVDGLLESGLLMNDDEVINAAIKAADKLFEVFNKNKYLKGRYDKDWTGSEFMITTGCAQTAIVWLKLFKHKKNIQYLNASLKINDQLIFIQDRKINESVNTKGALPGSFPWWGKYEPFNFPNWATKYFVDSLFLEQECLNTFSA